jgi:hypothetical protein
VLRLGEGFVLKSVSRGTTTFSPQSVHVPGWPAAVERTRISRLHFGQKKMIGTARFQIKILSNWSTRLMDAGSSALHPIIRVRGLSLHGVITDKSTSTPPKQAVK